MRFKKTAFLTALMMTAVMAAGCGGGKSGASASVSSVSSSSAAAAAPSTDPAEETPGEKADESQAEKLPVTDKKVTVSDCVRLGNYKGLKLTRIKYRIPDEMVKQYALSKKDYKEVTDPNETARDDDTVNIRFVGKMNGKEFEGGSADSYDLTLGSNNMIEGFEDGIVGMKKGETKELKLRFPDDYFESSLKGKDVTFTVTVNKISRAPEPTKAELADAKKELQSNYDSNAEEQLMQSAWSQVRDSSEFKQLRAADVKQEEENIEKSLQQELDQNQMSKEDYLKAQNLTEETYEKNKTAYAKNLAQEKLLIEALAEAEKVTENDAEYKAAVAEMAKMNGTSEKELLEQAGAEYVRQYALTQVISKRIVKYGTVSEKTMDAPKDSAQQ